MKVIRIEKQPLRQNDHRFRILLAADLHIGTTYGTYAGIGTWDRAFIMTDYLLREFHRPESYDLFIGNGDMTSNEENNFKERSSFFEQLQKRYMRRLKAENIPYAFIYANHDDLRDDAWERILGYPKDYIIDLGDDVSLVCLDMYYGHQEPEEMEWGYGAYADMKEHLYREASEHIRDKKLAFVICHFADDERTPLCAKFVREHDNVKATLVGHTHGVEIRTLGGKPRLGCGHFSWHGANWGLACDETALEEKGPWCFRCLEYDGERLDSYIIYPEHSYGEISGLAGAELGWITRPAFIQPQYDTKHCAGGTHIVLAAGKVLD